MSLGIALIGMICAEIFMQSCNSELDNENIFRTCK
jgi:hypothetical protein